ncbi:MAG TPA: tetratricopeptide repeat protein, partial [Hyphomicrobium sp.]|nr:tetratricopeptide repeat protein [Hyphomicrobium sp.]
MTAKPSIIADPEAALKQARQLLASDPNAATRQARQLLEASPGDPALLRLLAAGLRKTGQADEANEAEKQAIAASTRSPAHREAARAIAGGDKQRAAAILEALISRDENDVVALVMLGIQLSLEAEYDVAETLLRKAVAAAPADPAARMALTEHLHRAKRAAEALQELDKLAGRTTASQSLRASILRDLGRQEEEVALLKQLAEAEPRMPGYRIRLGHAYRTLGRTEDAVAAYRSVIAQSPHEGTSWWSLANLKTVKFSDADIAQMEGGLTNAQSPLTNRIRLNFALGKAFEDRGDPEQAFRHYQEGNRLRLTIATYRPEKLTHWVDDAEAGYST